MQLLLHHVSAHVGILPRDLKRRMTLADLLDWASYFHHLNTPAEERGRRNLLNLPPDQLARTLTGEEPPDG